MNRRTLSFLLPTAVALLASLAGWALLASVRGQLPSPLATHWGPDGSADGFTSYAQVVAWGVALPVGTAMLLGLLGLAMKHSAALSGVAAGTTVFVAGVSFGSAYAQRGLAAASDSQLSNAALMWPMAAGLAVGVLVGMALRTPATFRGAGPLPADSPRMAVADTARIAWSGHLRQSTAGITLMLVAVGVTLALGTVMWLTSGIWFVAVIGLLLALFIPMMQAQVRIDRRGVRISAYGVPLKTLPLSGVDHADVREVNALGEYGGFGLRGGFDGSWGFITSSGEALWIERGSDPEWALTVDDAESAAAVLNTLIERVRGHGTSPLNRG